MCYSDSKLKYGLLRLKSLQAESIDDPETAHKKADEVLIELLQPEIRAQVKEEFDKIQKFYS